MASSVKAFIWVVCFVLLLQLATSHFITLDALQANNMTEHPGRSLSQRKHHSRFNMPTKPCKVDFEKVNYMPLFKRCDPPYPVHKCCEGFKRVACKYTNELNDETSWCAFDMFGFINQYYPQGWFVNHCREGSLGLDCETL